MFLVTFYGGCAGVGLLPLEDQKAKILEFKGSLPPLVV